MWQTLKKIFKKKPKVAPIRTSGIMTFWYKHGCPNKLGQEIEVAMQSGKIAVFRLAKIERAWNVDWSWYDFEFVKYLN